MPGSVVRVYIARIKVYKYVVCTGTREYGRQLNMGHDTTAVVEYSSFFFFFDLHTGNFVRRPRYTCIRLFSLTSLYIVYNPVSKTNVYIVKPGTMGSGRVDGRRALCAYKNTRLGFSSDRR